MNNEEKWSQLYKGFFACGVQESGSQVRFMLSQNAERETAFLAQDIFARLLPTQKENMARALTCVQYTKLRLGPHVVKATFEQNKKKTEQQITTDIHGLMTGWLKEVRHEERMVAPVEVKPPAPRVVTPSVVLVPTLEQKMLAVMGSIRLGGVSHDGLRSGLASNLTNIAADSVSGRFQPVDGARRVGDGVVGRISAQTTGKIAELKADVSLALGRNQTYLTQLGTIVDVEYKRFKETFGQVAAAENAKREMMAKFATAALSEIPIVGNVVGEIAGSIIKSFKNDTDLLIEESTAGAKFVDQTALSTMFAKFKERVDNVKRRGVAATAMPGELGLAERIGASWRSSHDAMMKEFESQVEEFFKPSSTEAKTRQAWKRVNKFQAKGHVGSGLDAAVLDDIGNDCAALKKGVEQYMLNRALVVGNIAKYVELKFLTHYMMVLIGPEKFNAPFDRIRDIDYTLPDAIKKRLEHNNIIVSKGNRHSADLGTLKILPFDSGHVTHRLGLLLFFRWYSKVNPFDYIGYNTETTAQLQEAMDLYIVNIVKAIQSVKQNPKVGRATIPNTADAAASIVRLEQEGPKTVAEKAAASKLASIRAGAR